MKWEPAPSACLLVGLVIGATFEATTTGLVGASAWPTWLQPIGVSRHPASTSDAELLRLSSPGRTRPMHKLPHV